MGNTTTNYTDHVEIIDLESSSSTCTILPNFPYQTRAPIGGVIQGRSPLICGGYGNKCYLYENGSWISSHSMMQSRAYGVATYSPYPRETHELFVTGGFGSPLAQTTGIQTIHEPGQKSWGQGRG
jgi:hypothetical protein